MKNALSLRKRKCHKCSLRTEQTVLYIVCSLLSVLTTKNNTLSLDCSFVLLCILIGTNSYCLMFLLLQRSFDLPMTGSPWTYW